MNRSGLQSTRCRSSWALGVAAAFAGAIRLFFMPAPPCAVQHSVRGHVGAELEALRLFNCCECGRAVRVCGKCDKGRVYCTRGCAEVGRPDSFGTDPASGNRCLGSFGFNGVSASRINVSAAGRSLWQGGTGTFSIGGHKAGSGCSGGFFADFTLTDHRHNLLVSLDLLPSLSAAQFLTSDPMASLLGNMTHMTDEGDEYWDTTGNNFTISEKTELHRVSVPEPAPLE